MQIWSWEWLQTISFCFFSPGGALPSSAGAAEGSQGEWGCSQPSPAWAAPPSGRHLLLVAKCTAYIGWAAAESTAAGTECWSVAESRGRCEHLFSNVFKNLDSKLTFVNSVFLWVQVIILECVSLCLQLQTLRAMSLTQVLPKDRMWLWFIVSPNGKSAWRTVSNSTSCWASPYQNHKSPGESWQRWSVTFTHICFLAQAEQHIRNAEFWMSSLLLTGCTKELWSTVWCS